MDQSGCGLSVPLVCQVNQFVGVTSGSLPRIAVRKNGVASLAYVAGIHVFLLSCRPKAWMAGTSPAMTTERNGRKSKNERKRKRNAGRRSVSWPARKRRAVRTNERAACAALRLRARSPAGVPPRLSHEGLIIPRLNSGQASCDSAGTAITAAPRLSQSSDAPHAPVVMPAG